MQTTHPPPPLLRSGHIYMEDVHSAESIEKSYWRFSQFLFFELWLIWFTIYGDILSVTQQKKAVRKWPNFQERSAIIWQWFFNPWVFFLWLLVFEIWLVLQTCGVTHRLSVTEWNVMQSTKYKINRISKIKVHKKNSRTKK